MSLAILGGTGKLHRFLLTVLGMSATIEVAAAPKVISIVIAVAVVIEVVAIPISVMIPIATIPTLIPIMISVVVAIMIAVDMGYLRRIHQKIRAAATINPNSLLIESPSLILNTSRLAVLAL